MRYGMLIDLRKCVGCGACTVACRAENGTPAGISFNKLKKYEVGKYPTAKMKSLPLPCMHCKIAPCVTVCPSRATVKNDEGIVTVDTKQCMGCRACIMACPYESRQFVWDLKTYYEDQNATPFEKKKYVNFEKGTVAKCVFCIERIELGEKNACVHTCPANCRFFGDLDDPESEISKLISQHGAIPLRGELGTEPSVFYIWG